MATNEKILNTRIQLKYDSFSNWSTKNPTLKQGELAIAYLASSHTTTTPDNGIHPVLFKVGPGQFNSLPWASALAADVYAWAKKENPDWNDFPALPIEIIDNGSGKFVTDIVYEENKITISRSDVSWDDITNKPDFNLIDTVTTVTAGNGINVTSDNADDPTYTVSHANTSDVKNVTAADRTYVKSLTFDDYGHVTAVTTGTETVVDTNTAHTHVNGSGIKVSAAGGIDGEVKADLNIAFELVNKTIKLYDKSDSTKAAIATLDASSFIKDGMLNDVAYDAETNTLTFTWNTDAGISTDTVELSDILDPYTAGAKIVIDGTEISHAEIAAPIATAGSGRTYLTGVTTDGHGHITGYTTASESDQDLSNYKTKQEAYSATGSTVKTITAVSQNANGEIAVTYDNIAFPVPPVVNDGKFTVSGTGALTGSGSMTANQAGDTTATLDIAAKGVTTAKIADKAVGAEQTKAYAAKVGDTSEEVWVFYCGTATDLV